MKNISILFVTLVFVVFHYSCSEKTCDLKQIINKGKNKIVVRELNDCENKRILTEQEFLKENDSLVADGYFKRFYNNGTLKELGFYKNNIQDSINIKFYPSGLKEVEDYYAEGHLSGPQYAYYPDEKLKWVQIFKNDSVKWSTVTYDEKGHIQSTDGLPIHILAKPDFELAKVGEKMSLLNMISEYKKTYAILNIKLKNENKVLIDTIITKFSSVINMSYYGFGYKFKTPGKYDYTAHVVLKDSSTDNVIMQHSVQAKIDVK